MWGGSFFVPRAKNYMGEKLHARALRNCKARGESRSWRGFHFWPLAVPKTLGLSRRAKIATGAARSALTRQCAPLGARSHNSLGAMF